MTHKTFNWSDESSWTKDYRKEFNNFKQVVANSFHLFYPDYNLPWTLRVDASQLGVGGVLLQEKDGVKQPIMCISSKFSDPATRWSTIEQEAYAMYYAVYKLSYYLRCKEFVLETDHRNLIWMSSSIVPKIIRWYIYLNSFKFHVRHIPDKVNIIADMLSRQWSVENSPSKQLQDTLNYLCYHRHDDSSESDFDRIMRQVHGHRNGHLGADRTWHALNEFAPGHGFSMAMIRDYVNECPICQKDRVLKSASIPPAVKTLHVEHARSTIAIDTLSILPAVDGTQYLLVVVNMFTRYVYLYPVKDKEAITTANCLFHYMCTFGLIDEIRSDQGSDFVSQVVTHLLDWLGPRRLLTLPNNPQADGVEGTSKQLHRHLLALCMDEKCKHQWSSLSVLPIIQLIVNEHIHSETGVSPLHAQFGDVDTIYRQLPSGPPTDKTTHAYVKLLSANLKSLRVTSAAHQKAIKDARLAKTPPQSANKYAKGDLVMYRLLKMDRADKLTPRNQGPYEVVHHGDTNWVDVRDLVFGDVKTFDQSDLQIFVGTKEDATRLAQFDHNQFIIDSIVAHRGNPDTRTTMEFEVRYLDKTVQWQPWSKDLFDTQQYADYCNSLPQLRPLVLTKAVADQQKKKVLLQDISLVQPTQTVYVDLRSWGATWYARLTKLPFDKDHTTYVVKCIYGSYSGPKSYPRRKIEAQFPDMKESYSVDNYFVTTYGHDFTVKSGFVLLTASTIAKYGLLDKDSK